MNDVNDLITWLKHEADLADANGPTRYGYNLALAASLLSTFDKDMRRRLEELSAEVRRLERLAVRD